MKYYLTTPLYYVNAAPHIGHVYCTMAAETIARFKRMQGFDAVMFTGTDEHGQKVERSAEAARKSPGQLKSHYAPARPVRLNATSVDADEGLLAFGPNPPAGAVLTYNLSPTSDLGEAAANLFAQLRALDRPGIGRIAVMPVPESGLGLAINDRLRRAAADDGAGRGG